jgi:hypothetical protein
LIYAEWVDALRGLLPHEPCDVVGALVSLAVGQPTSDWFESILPARVLDVSKKLSTFPNKVGAATEQVPPGALLLRIDVRHREHAAPKEPGDLVGVDPIVLRRL